MKSKHYITILLVTGIFLGVFSSAVPFGSAEAENVDVIVGFTGVPDLGLLRQSGGEVFHVYSIIPAVYVSLPEAAIEPLKANPKIAYIEEDGLLKESGQIVDWGVERVKASQAWSQSTGGGVKVAVLDTGVGPHEDLNVSGGIDLVNNDGDPSDDDGHGTMVAGIIAAASNSVGVVGVAPSAQIYAVKILNSRGEGTVNRAISGIQWAMNNNMQIISMSWTLNDENYALQRALQAAYSRGILLVAAAGNTGNVEVMCPASYDEVIAVAATQPDNTRALFSCVGPKIELAAPGQNIYSTYSNPANPNWYGYGNGTSMAAPFVSGTAALVWAKNPNLTNAQVRDILQKTAFDLEPNYEGRDIWYGFGLVDAGAAVSATPSNFNVGFSWSPSTNYSDGTVTFDASASFGHVSGYTEYTWNFGDGTNATVDTPTVTHTFAVNGSYSVNLTVSDVFGFKNSTVNPVTVLQDNVPPVTVDNYDGLLHKSAFTVALTGSDNESGVAETYYRINDGSTRTVRADGQPLINVDGLNNKLEYWSVDSAGNEEVPHKVLAGIKLNTTTISIEPSPSVSPTQSPPPTHQPTDNSTKPTATPTGSPEETLPPDGQGFSFWVVCVIFSVAVMAVAVAVVFWLKRK